MQAQSLARISGIESHGKPVSETKDVRVTQIASARPADKVTVGMSLNSSDLLESVSGGTLLKVSCSRGTSAHLSGKFRAMVSAKPDLCLVNLLAGKLHVSAEEPTEVRLAGVVAGSQGTRYGIQAEAEGASFVVFEDKINLVFSGSAEPRVLGEGRQIVYRQGGELQDGPIASEEYDHAADVVARLDMAEAVAAGHIEHNPFSSEVHLAALRLSYSRVLRSPGDPSAREALATARTALERTRWMPFMSPGNHFQEMAMAKAPHGRGQSGPIAARKTAQAETGWYIIGATGLPGVEVSRVKGSVENRVHCMAFLDEQMCFPVPAGRTSYEAIVREVFRDDCVASSINRLVGIPDFSSGRVQERHGSLEEDGGSLSDLLSCYQSYSGAVPAAVR